MNRHDTTVNWQLIRLHQTAKKAKNHKRTRRARETLEKVYEGRQSLVGVYDILWPQPRRPSHQLSAFCCQLLHTMAHCCSDDDS